MYDDQIPPRTAERARALLPTLLAALATVVVAGTLAAQDENQPRQGRRAPDPERIVSRAWWNQENVSAELGLSEAQRAKADEQLRAFLAGRPERQKMSRDAQAAFQAALEAGRDASAEIEGLRAASLAAVTANAELKVAVMKLLTAEQRTKLKEKFPLLLRRSWMSGGATRTPRIRRAQPQADEPPGR